ncbi:spore germination protein [Bacillus thuringiensis]|uniref:Spore germination protein n=1 Tax=Bacillus thuringiensis TaxID=1428 RepID=A0ABD6SG80_BACTU|nr:MULTISPECIES: spore germination protein [Bacillus]KIZ30181.1 spore gernimation protein [Bacillus cereus]MBJ8127385.1 spore germination protein [Bacillus cereus]PDY98432.1 spore germination protein [Bacillus thuringiensis]PEF29429.1 spore germination protein [Bacillus thuringiensis]PES78944.1 spore germination protein [Bacillus thuringiensis]
MEKISCSGKESNQKNFMNTEIIASLDKNIEFIKKYMGDAPDLVIRRIQKGNYHTLALVYLSELTDKKDINDSILKPLLREEFTNEIELIIPIGNISRVLYLNQIQESLLEGNAILLVNEYTVAYKFEIKGGPNRQPSDSKNEISIKGTHQGFVEAAGKNIALIRNYLPTAKLTVTSTEIGEEGKTKIHVLFLMEKADFQIIAEAQGRLENIKVNSIVNTGELVKHIEDNPYSPFPQLLLTERPDTAVSSLLDGKFVIVVDHSPNVLIGPTNFLSFFRNIDDCSTRWMINFFLQILRIVAFFLALILPATYIALISFNYSLIPVPLFLSIAESRENVPFSAIVEAMIMEITLEMMREAALRLPAPIGQTMGIVGGIIIGQAAVQAGIVSNIMIIIVSVTAIASFTVPNYDMSLAVRYLRFPMMLLATWFGFVGIIIGLMILLAHILSIRSIGTPYGVSFFPLEIYKFKNFILKYKNETKGDI